MFTLSCVTGGIGLLRGKQWSRPLVLTLSSLNLLAVPVGTAIGLYGLWVLLTKKTRLLLQT